ncbi:MAG: helix-turn-helix transcriptional regulator [Planctomycetales bacterium]
MQAAKQTLNLSGEEYVVIRHDEYERLTRMAKAAELPPLPEPDAKGNYPALEYMRASLARDVIRDRARLGLSQAELARRAGIRVETLNRIEGGKVLPSIASIDKIDRALKAAEAAAGKAAGSKRRTANGKERHGKARPKATRRKATRKAGR